MFGVEIRQEKVEGWCERWVRGEEGLVSEAGSAGSHTTVRYMC